MIIVFVTSFIWAVANALSLAIFVRVILSWLPGTRIPFGVGEFSWSVSEPILAPIRRALPMAAGLDFSPFIAILAIQFVEWILLQIVATSR
jgi:YggT family protein